MTHADGLGTLEVEHLVRGPVREHQGMRLDQVVDVDVVAELGSVAVDGDRLVAQRHPHEPGNHERAPHARPVRDAVAEDRELLPVEREVVVCHQLARQLRRRIDVVGAGQVERRILGDDTAAARGAVHPHGAGEHHASHAVAPRRLPHLRRAEDVELGGADGVGDRLVHVGHRGQMEHHLAALGRAEQAGVVEDVDVVVLDIGAMWTPRVDDDDRVTVPRQAVDDVRPDEAGAARDCDSHDCMDAITDAGDWASPDSDCCRPSSAPSLPDVMIVVERPDLGA